jgi:hypothetical protein
MVGSIQIVTVAPFIQEELERVDPINPSSCAKILPHSISPKITTPQNTTALHPIYANQDPIFAHAFWRMTCGSVLLSPERV